MKCARCPSIQSDVIDSRPSGPNIRRRRQCCLCRYRFTTYESVIDQPVNYRMVEIHLKDIEKTSQVLRKRIEQAGV
jgi:transcriptional regulator NrdR family protein